MRSSRNIVLIGALLLAGAKSAHADPCTSRLPAAGTTFQGTARYIVDGDGLCISQSSDPRTWVEVRLADFYAPELREPGGEKAKAALGRIVSGKIIRCLARNRSYDRIVAQCNVGGRSLADLLRQAGVSEGGRAYRNH